MGGQPFFAGETVGSVDVSFYGMLAGFLFAQCEISQCMIEGADSSDWVECMKKIAPLTSLFA